jgi:hypothetical protein
LRGRLRTRSKQVPLTDPLTKGLLGTGARKKAWTGARKNARKKAKREVQGSRKTSKGSEMVGGVVLGEKTESEEGREKRLKGVLAAYGKRNGHRIVGYAEGGTIFTVEAGLAQSQKGSVSKARVAFEKDLRARPKGWRATTLFFELKNCTYFPTGLQVPTLPGHHQGFFPLADITNRQVGCCGLTAALLSAMQPYVPTLGGDGGSLLRVSCAVLQAKKKGGINCEVMSGKNAVQLLRALADTKLEYPPEKIDVSGALRAIKEKPLQIRHPIFLVSSKCADSGHYLRANGGFPSLRGLLPAELLEAIEHDYNKAAANKTLQREAESEEASGPEEMSTSEELAAVDDEENEGDYNTSDFEFDEEDTAH